MDNPNWYQDAIFYELHVRSFQDGDQDGVGDFSGLTQRLDYLADLGITAVWLLPFTRSPLKDDGYDIADYTSVHPSYGTLDDFRTFLEKAHSVGIRVITELVINHTSDQHAWFQRARNAPPNSPERDFYVWSDNPEKYSGVPLMFPDFETSNWSWDPVAKQYYWHRFYSHQPDLNFDNPAVRDAILPLVDFWFEIGVDGMRLDAVPYLYEREGTSCEHLPETHAFLKSLRKHVDEKFPGRMFLAEANAWPDEMVSYFGSGDECQMAFHFPLMPRLYMALYQENRFPIVDILAQTPAIPANCQWCLFLRNHDELTLAMVTDEERDAMYNAYAGDLQARLFLGIRHRLAPLLRNDRRRIELMNALLFSLPGSPVIYYGDEIGMGDNIYLGDRNGVRTPMQWSDDRNAGFSRANSQKLYSPVIVNSEYHYEAINVEAQQINHSSLLWWMKRLIAIRKRHPAFGRGEMRMLEPANAKILAYVRKTESESLLIIANLSRFVQHVQIDLSDYPGLVPEELFGRTRFPVIRPSEPYNLTLGPHDFYWFELTQQTITQNAADELPLLPYRSWPNLFGRAGWDRLGNLLTNRHNARTQATVIACRLLEQHTFPVDGLDVQFIAYRLEYATEAAETVFQFLAFVPEDRFNGSEALPRAFAIARTNSPPNDVLCDPLVLPEFKSALLSAFVTRVPLPLTTTSEIICTRWDGFPEAISATNEAHAFSMPSGEISTVVVALTPEIVMRVLRRPDEGINLDVEVGKFLEEKSYQGLAELIGTCDYRRLGTTPMTIASLRRFVVNQGNAWQLMLDQASRFFDVMAARSMTNPEESDNAGNSHEASTNSAEDWETLLSPFLETARLLGTFTAQLHLTLASAPGTSRLAPVPLHQRSFYQTARNSAGRLHSLLTNFDPDWPDDVKQLGIQVSQRLDTILRRIQTILHPSLAGGRRIQSHGNLRLGRLLVSGQDFILADFEGKRDRPMGERRVKQTPMFDVAMLLSSIEYAISSVRLGLVDKPSSKLGLVRDEDRDKLKTFATTWYLRMKQLFLQTYTTVLETSDLLPRSEQARQQLLEVCLLSQALVDAEYDLIHRHKWAVIPLTSILNSVERDEFEHSFENKGNSPVETDSK